MDPLVYCNLSLVEHNPLLDLSNISNKKNSAHKKTSIPLLNLKELNQFEKKENFLEISNPENTLLKKKREISDNNIKLNSFENTDYSSINIKLDGLNNNIPKNIILNNTIKSIGAKVIKSESYSDAEDKFKKMSNKNINNFIQHEKINLEENFFSDCSENNNEIRAKTISDYNDLNITSEIIIYSDNNSQILTNTNPPKKFNDETKKEDQELFDEKGN